MKKIIPIYLCLVSILSLPLQAKIDLVTLPSRDNVALTLYKSQSMTFVQETRSLSLIQGINELQFSWLHTQIDPASIHIIPKNPSQDIDIKNIRFPAHMDQMAIWKINSTRAITVPMQLRYLTAGLDWRAYYVAILSTDEKSMQLKGVVRVNNHSGESYENAKIYLVMGSVNMLDPIEKLSYGHPEKARSGRKKGTRVNKREVFQLTAQMDSAMHAPTPNVMKMATASEYAVFEFDRRENLKDKWDRQLILMENQAIPVTNVYQFNAEKYGKKVVRLIKFQNRPTRLNQQKEMPLPGGKIQIYRDIYKNKHFTYEGKAHLDDIPVGKTVEIILGDQNQVTVDKKRMKNRTDHYQFDTEGNILSWEEFFQDRIELNNTRSVSVMIEVICRLNATNWKIDLNDEWVMFEKINQHTIKFCALLDQHTQTGFSYDVHINHRNNSGVIGNHMGR